MDHCFTGITQANVRAAAQSPCTFHGNKSAAVERYVHALFLGRELHHSPARVGVTERREDLAAHPEIGVAHVTFLFRARQAACDPAKILSGNHSVDAESLDRIALIGAG